MGTGKEQVRRVIQHKGTGLYLMESGQWTPDLDQAHQLPNILAAVRLARALNPREIELVLKFEDGNYDLRLEL